MGGAIAARVAVVGDYDPENETHAATDAALEHAGLDAEWIPTDELELDRLTNFDGLWIAPASPYRKMDAALEAIRYARERGVPLVGT